ncbi:NAD-dependent epimerase/dehydratase family protein [Nonomuraea turkmeniaca]|uniref:NAD-dependent epimerase/dehydratase family protein n=1 Tax=Nonomuraea turkmeniaca TaxID=103838 RepID=A0A5S4FXP0_9ACTN|nr:NAD-dependent epimerase/dehydratase family protein [Nonomuraea turkmeniaca]
MILVTGATGNVGSHVVRQLLEAGQKVRVITRNPSGQAFPDQVEVATGDLTQPESLTEALSGIERAFLFPFFQGVDGFLDVAKRAGLRHVVMLSSISVTWSVPSWVGEAHLRLERSVQRPGCRGPSCGLTGSRPTIWSGHPRSSTAMSSADGTATPRRPRSTHATSPRSPPAASSTGAPARGTR